MLGPWTLLLPTLSASSDDVSDGTYFTIYRSLRILLFVALSQISTVSSHMGSVAAVVISSGKVYFITLNEAKKMTLGYSQL